MMAFLQYAMQILFSLLMASLLFIMLPRAAASASGCPFTSPVTPGSAKHLTSPEFQPSPGLQLDAAENKAVSMLVGAGLVSAGTVVGLRARRESVRARGTVRDVG